MRTRISNLRPIIALVQGLRTGQFAAIEFSEEDQWVYREFAREMCEHITKIESGAKYFDDLARLRRQLREVYQNVVLEETIPNAALVIRCFIDGAYYYRKAGFPVESLATSSTSFAVRTRKGTNPAREPPHPTGRDPALHAGTARRRHPILRNAHLPAAESGDPRARPLAA